MRLMEVIGCGGGMIDIRPSCEQMLKDLGHPYASGQPVYDITFENVQAGERTSHLFRLANHQDALVVGTGDLSELALGWCTYGVGDMSHYNVNASVPKTLIQHGALGGRTRRIRRGLQPRADRCGRDRDQSGAGARRRLRPAAAVQRGQRRSLRVCRISTSITLRSGFAPSKVAFLALHTWGDAAAGRWPEGVTARNAYPLAEIRRHLRTFLWRFFKTSQFKRDCVPNSPKVGSGGSLSPRGAGARPAMQKPRSGWAIWSRCPSAEGLHGHNAAHPDLIEPSPHALLPRFFSRPVLAVRDRAGGDPADGEGLRHFGRPPESAGGRRDAPGCCQAGGGAGQPGGIGTGRGTRGGACRCTGRHLLPRRRPRHRCRCCRPLPRWCARRAASTG